MTQQEFNQMLAVAIAGGLGGGTYISRWDGEQIDDGIGKVLLPGGITTLELADDAVTWPKLAVDARPTRRNLLINSYFVGGGSQQGGGQFPINQRGQTKYTAAGYSIDRWYAISNTELALQSDGVYFSGNTANGGLAQQIETFKMLSGKQMTLSILVPALSGELTVAYFYHDGTFHQVAIGEMVSAGLGVFTFTPVFPANAIYFGVRFYAKTNVTTSYTAAAAKLELGDKQTLAHQDADGNWVLNDPPPDFELELLKCQRYFQTFATQSQRPTKGADFRPVMRTENPTLGTITLPDGTVLYTASSEL